MSSRSTKAGKGGPLSSNLTREMKRPGHQRSLLGASLLAAIGLGACGSTRPSSPRFDPAQTRIVIDTSARPAIGGALQAGEPIVTVGTTVITKRALGRRIAIEARGGIAGLPVPSVPSHISACAASLEARVKATHIAPVSRQKLTEQCTQAYRALRENVLNSLIANEWAIGEAADQGLAVDDRRLRNHLELELGRQFGTNEKFQRFLKQSGENVYDLLFNLKQQLAVQALRAKVESSAKSDTPQAVARYYQEHKRAYAVREQRDIGIIRTNLKSTALTVKRELEAGVSFGTIARQLPDQQPIYSVRDGLVPNLEPHVFSESVINDAIFSARPNVVVGPVKLHVTPHYRSHTVTETQKIDGYYVFRINAVRAPYQKSLAQVKQSITKALPEILRLQALAAFTSRWRDSWRSKTNCRLGYIVRKCRQFATSAHEPPEDPYSLD